jgi:leucyl-tRNA synthetase
MGVPAHDDRDLLFANEHGLPVVKVIEVSEKEGEGVSEGREEEENGVLVNSEQFTGMSIEQGRREITRYAEREGFGGHMTQYKLRDWLISRQRYWGAPIPVLYCDKCGVSHRD